ncbi:MAG: hypothetical protein FWB81_02160 [Cystobacterineae bacterium]|nr:hypothetical protein [Cystobacterineae bacterium]
MHCVPVKPVLQEQFPWTPTVPWLLQFNASLYWQLEPANPELHAQLPAVLQLPWPPHVVDA